MIGAPRRECPMSDLHRNYITEPDTFRRMEVITGVARRRRWPRSEKARIVAESYAPGASATAVAVPPRPHRNQNFSWGPQLRHQEALVGEAPAVVPVILAAVAVCGSLRAGPGAVLCRR